MNTNKELTLTYQFCSIYYSNFYGMLAKIQEFLEDYDILIQNQHLYYVNPDEPMIERIDEIVIGEITPLFIPNPILLEYEITKEHEIKGFIQKIHQDILDKLDKHSYTSEERIEVRIKHKWK